MKGLVPSVPLSCGSVLMHANVYVGDKVPFGLLLGRPWQRGNFVSIEECEDGTYLLFKDKNLDVRHEVLVTPEDIVIPDPYSHEYFNHIKQATAYVNAIFVKDVDQTVPMDVDGPVDESGTSQVNESRLLTGPQESKGLVTYDADTTDDNEVEFPGLHVPQTASKFRTMSNMWAATAINLLSNSLSTNDEAVPMKVKGKKPLRILDKDSWQLVQVLMKRDTRDWRKTSGYLHAVRKPIESSTKSRKRAAADNLKRLVLNNARIKRLWALTRKIQDVTQYISDQVRNSWRGKTYSYGEGSRRSTG